MSRVENSSALSRKNFRKPLGIWGRELFGDHSASLLNQLKNVCPHNKSEFERWARRILRICSEMGKSEDRVRYAEGCIRNEKRIAELENWLADNPDPYCMWDHEDLVGENASRAKAKSREIDKLENELDVLKSRGGGYKRIMEKVGLDAALKIVEQLHKQFDPDKKNEARKMNSILLRAGEWDIKHPRKYVERAIANERAMRRERERY